MSGEAIGGALEPIVIYSFTRILQVLRVVRGILLGL